MINKKLIAILAATFVMALTCGCSGTHIGDSLSATEVREEVIHLSYAEINPEDTIAGQMALAFKEKTEELSGGKLVIDVKFNGECGAEDEVLNSMLNNENQVDITRISPFVLTSYGTEKTMLLGLPYTFSDREHFWNFASSDLSMEFLKEIENNQMPIRGLFYGEEGFRHFFTNKKVKSVQDLKGKNVRVSKGYVLKGMIDNLGADSTYVEFSELEAALKDGLVDAAEQPIVNYYSNGFYKQAPNLILDGHILGILEVIISEKTWESLSPEQQEILKEAGTYAQEVNRECSEQEEKEILDKLKEEGVNVIKVSPKEREDLKKLCKGSIDEYARMSETYSRLYDAIQALDQ